MGSGASKENDTTAVGEANVKYDLEHLIFPSFNTSEVQLSIQCKNLKNMDAAKQGLSDPFVVLKSKNSMESPWQEVGRTEICSNNLNPQFVRLITVCYRFEEIQYLRFEVYDADSSYCSSNADAMVLEKQDFEGAAECALALIIGSPDQRWTTDLVLLDKSGKRVPAGEIVVVAEEVPNQNKVVEFDVAVQMLAMPKVQMKKVIGIFFQISRTTEGNDSIPCYRSEVVPDLKNPQWKRVKSSLTTLCAGDTYRPLQFDIFGYRRSGNHEHFGKLLASVNDFEDQKKQVQLKGAGSGTVNFFNCSISIDATFLDYIAGGMEIGFQCAIDYTGSNGDPSDPRSLHYMHGKDLNDYARAIRDVGAVIEYYDTDKRFPVYGFGGKPYASQPVQHCFAVSGNEEEAEVVGIKGILDAYHSSLSRVILSGPTLFAPVINQAAAIAASLQTKDPGKQVFNILMIITDGLINDMENTVDAIVAASILPISIIIVGVGRADFSSMIILDADDSPLVSSNGKSAKRDIVQFVPLKNFSDDTRSLAKEVLAEVPKQIVDYMKLHNIKPNSESILQRGQSVHQLLQERQSTFKTWERKNSRLA